MKKSLIALGLITITGATYAQKKNRTSAIMALKNGYVAKAKGYIDKAIVHEKTKEDPKTWFYYAQIHGALAGSQDEKLAKFDKEEAAESMLTGLRNTTKFDKDGDYTNQVKQVVAPLYSMALNQGIAMYQEKKYEDALETFKGTQEIAEIIGVVDSVGIFNAAISAKALGKSDEAIKYYEKAAEIGYAGSDPYFNLISLNAAKKDSEGTLKAIKAARAKYPNDANVLLEQTRYYIENGQSDKAEADLIAVIDADPKNTSLRHALGVVYEQIGKPEKAIESYKAALAIDFNHKPATKNLGLAYNSMAAKVNEEMNAVPLNQQAKYTELKTKRDALLNEGLPFLEKAYADGQDANLKRVLNSVYRVLKLNDKIMK